MKRSVPLTAALSVTAVVSALVLMTAASLAASSLPTLTLAVYRAIYAAMNAKLQMDALRLGGEVTYLSDDEVAAVVTYIRVSWGNPGAAVSAGEANALRSAPLQ